MARYRDASCRLCRREKMKLMLKGDRCLTAKCAITKRRDVPGPSNRKMKQLSEYGIQMREKQKVKRIYGVLEKQFRNYYHEAIRIAGVSGENLLRLLELRLDNVVYRLGLAKSRNQARQFITHGFISVNGRRMTIPSYCVKSVAKKLSGLDGVVHCEVSLENKSAQVESSKPITESEFQQAIEEEGYELTEAREA